VQQINDQTATAPRRWSKSARKCVISYARLDSDKLRRRQPRFDRARIPPPRTFGGQARAGQPRAASHASRCTWSTVQAVCTC